MATPLMEGSSLQALADLLHPPDIKTDEDKDVETGPSPYCNPGAIGPATATAVERTRESENIWNNDEITADAYDYSDTRQQPEYEMVFKQSVSSEDMFLGMGNKTPLSSSCDILVIRIVLPGAELDDINSIITQKFLDCSTPNYRLGLHLPHPVDADTSKARWLAEQSILEVELKLEREYDFLNK